MKKTELIIGYGIILFMILRLLFNYPYSALLISLFSLILSLMYFGLSFALLNGIRLRNLFKKESYKGISNIRIIGTIATGLVLSLIVIGMLFKYQRWPYGNSNLMIALMGLVPILIITVVKFFNSKSTFYKNMLSRLLIIGFSGVILLFTKSEQLLEMKYRNYPNYVEAEKKLMNDPMNKELQELVREERMKMDAAK